jgi:four helix bundle protein
MHNFKQLKIWQKSIDFAVDIYKLTQALPKEEQYTLVSQMRRAVVSIASNIAEGTGRKTCDDFNRFLVHSLGSCYELETQLIISNKLKFIEEEDYHSSTTTLKEIQKMIVGFQKSLNAKT